jgi:hypothetical protein
MGSDMLKMFSGLFLTAFLCGCWDEGSSSPIGPKVNEVMVLNTQFPNERGELRPWMELVNDSDVSIRLSDYVLRIDGDSWQLPDAIMEPGEFYVLQSLANVHGSGEEFLSRGPSEVEIFKLASLRLVDRIVLPLMSEDESVARFPNASGRFFAYPTEKVTFRQSNPDLGFIKKLAPSTAFRPRDSSPNAVLRYDGHFWVLGGWSNFGGENWHSYTDVWRSKDAVRWELINETPPYVHYSSFVVWRNRMWAIGPSTFSSTDGVYWRPEPLQSPAANRSVVFKGSIINIYGTTVRSSTDGITWTTLTNQAPWATARLDPSVLVYRNRLWFIGGMSNYGAPNQAYHSDVWSSSDGQTWEQVTASSNWLPRGWISAIVHDGKMFLLGGANNGLWPEEAHNTSEIWFSDNGHEWFELRTEQIWGARHASLTVSDGRGGTLLMAGFGWGDVSRIYNDVWELRASIYFPKPEGDVHKLSTWGRNTDGTGPSPGSFSTDNQVFMLRNRALFTADERFAVSGAGSRIVVGDGQNPVRLEITNQSPASQPLYLYSNSTTVVRGGATSSTLFAAGATSVLYAAPDATFELE